MKYGTAIRATVAMAILLGWSSASDAASWGQGRMAEDPGDWSRDSTRRRGTQRPSVAQKKVPKKVAAIFAGIWKGSATFEKGKHAGSTRQWTIAFGKDFTTVRGEAMFQLRAATLQDINLGKRTVYFILTSTLSSVAEFSGGRMVGRNQVATLNCQGKFNTAFTKITGTFNCSAGRGSFALTKQGLSAPAEILKGDWTGTCAGTKGKLAGQSGEMKLAAANGSLAGATLTFFPDKITSLRIEPTGWNKFTRRITFVLVYKKGKKDERTIRFRGKFNRDFTELKGKFEGKKSGAGKFELSKRPHPEKKQ